jgi:hypothetical protein
MPWWQECLVQSGEVSSRDSGSELATSALATVHCLPLWLVPLACATLWVWLEVLRGWLLCWRAAALQASRQHLDLRAETPPCALCGNERHTYVEHVRIPQAELAGREEAG